jgi:hypothetical protein
MTLILVRDHTSFRYVPAVMPQPSRLLVHLALLALTSSMSYWGKVTLFEGMYIIRTSAQNILSLSCECCQCCAEPQRPADKEELRIFQ